MASDIFSFLSDTLAFSIVLVVKGGQGKMSKSLLRTDKEIAEIYKRHSKTVYRVCFAYMKILLIPRMQFRIHSSS